VSHRNSKLVLRDNTYSTIQWDAFSAPELGNFIQILQREEELYIAKVGVALLLCIVGRWEERCWGYWGVRRGGGRIEWACHGMALRYALCGCWMGVALDCMGVVGGCGTGFYVSSGWVWHWIRHESKVGVALDHRMGHVLVTSFHCCWDSRFEPSSVCTCVILVKEIKLPVVSLGKYLSLNVARWKKGLPCGGR